MWKLFKQAFVQWRLDNAALLAASLSYFTVFSLAPLLILLIALTGLVLGPSAAEGKIMEQVQVFIGSPAARFIESLIDNARQRGMGTASVFSGLLLIVGASGLFSQVQAALNAIWNTDRPRSGGFGRLVRNRLLLFTLLLFVGLLMLAFFALNASLAALSNAFGGLLPVFARTELLRLANFGASFVVLAVFTAVIFKLLPDTRIAWRDVWVGALVTAILLSVATLLIGLYFTLTDLQSIYGVAGSIIAVLIWIYYSAQIFLYGAECAWIYANTYGSRAPRAA